MYKSLENMGHRLNKKRRKVGAQSLKRAMRFRKNDPAHNLLIAVQHYVESIGGSVVVIGGIEIQQWSALEVTKFRVAVRCVGRRPEKSTETKAA